MRDTAGELKLPNPPRKGILAVVVTYHPDVRFPGRLKLLADQVDFVLVVDNHSNESAVATLQEAASWSNVSLVLNTENVGVAAALNIGLRYAVAAGYEWALLFDQDSVPADNIVEGLQEAYDQFPTKDKLAVIGSNYRNPRTAETDLSLGISHGRSWRERTVVITSGSLISLRAYQMIGPFKDEYFIDCVDLEYCLRARSKGFKVIITTTPLMVHGIGQTTLHRLLWKKTSATNHSPLRRYYMTRNQVALARDYLLKEPAWMLANFATFLKSIIFLLLFEEDRLTKARYLALGLLDGLLSNFGRKLSDRDGGAASATHRHSPTSTAIYSPKIPRR